MHSNNNDLYSKHISTHTYNANLDRIAVSTLETFLNSKGRINTNFSCGDKWPNHDGTFEFVRNPEISRVPEQNFIVQIKGTSNYKETNDGKVSYSLNSLAFPAFIANGVTLDPGIIFVVIIDPNDRSKKRVFWKYVSSCFIKSIDFNKGSTTIQFTSDDEIKNTDESINKFCNELIRIVDSHIFISKLDKDNLREEDAIKIIKSRCEDISLEIDRINNYESRDNISKRIINSLYDLCYAVLILNAINNGYSHVNEMFAWEFAQLNIETKYLTDFLKGLKYIGARVPDEGQSERLMIKYYNYLWEIRKYLKNNAGMDVLENLEKFPLHTDNLDTEYYKMVADSIADVDLSPTGVMSSIYYIQKKTPFFVDGERFFEITLQLAGLYTTKFNRITVYTKQNISTNYSIQIAYTNAEISLWGIKSNIKVVTNWKVSISSRCLNKLGKILKMDIKLTKKHGEYSSLMDFLTKTGMNFFDLINLHDNRFKNVLDEIYNNTNTKIFKEIILKLRNDYSISLNKGKYTVYYILLNLREELLESVITTKFDKNINDDLCIKKGCYPFEKNPFILNLPGKKTNKGNIKEILEITNDYEKLNTISPYLKIERLIHETGQLYHDADLIATQDDVQKYNDSLDDWDRNNGLLINTKDKFLSIDSYEKTSIYILEKLLKLSKEGNKGQKEYNAQYLKQCNIEFEDPLKKSALEKAFVNSQIMLIYGAAGTGKTTLINYISNMMHKEKKLFLTKTHTALQNLKRSIENPGPNSDFVSIDSFKNKVSLTNYNIVFVDECSTIDNRTMYKLLKKINEGTLLVLVGDIYQIESIDFSNWFYYAKDIIKSDGANIELLNTWRTDKQELKSLWNEVRLVDPIITEKLVIDGSFSSDIGEDIFVPDDEDEVVLCLNYDGKFGLNNINLYFQNNNTKSDVYTWGEWTFKVGDPIIFLDTRRSSLLYNNLKGRIVGISKTDNSISFTIDIDIILTERQCKGESFEFIYVKDCATRIRIEVISDNDELMSNVEIVKTIIPFQIAYAISIHKAQGLEYKSVKIIIPSCNTENISHSIFYTAITRAKDKLKIFWSAETMEGIIKSFNEEKVKKESLSIIKKNLKID